MRSKPNRRDQTVAGRQNEQTRACGRTQFAPVTPLPRRQQRQQRLQAAERHRQQRESAITATTSAAPRNVPRPRTTIPVAPPPPPRDKNLSRAVSPDNNSMNLYL